MEEVRFIEHKGHLILRIEFPGQATKERIWSIIEEAERMIEGYRLNQALTLTIMGDFHCDSGVAKRFEAYARHNKPYMKAGAVLGIKGLRKAIYNALMMLTRRSIKIFEDLTAAQEYLAAND